MDYFRRDFIYPKNITSLTGMIIKFHLIGLENEDFILKQI